MDIKRKGIKTLSRAENCLSNAPPLSLHLPFLFLSLAAPLLSKDQAVQNDLVYRNRS